MKERAGDFTTDIRRRAGHPWDGRPGFDLMLIIADTDAARDRAVECAKAKFWQAWLVGTATETGRPGAVMYKPSYIRAAWDDCPEVPHPGIVEERSQPD